MSPKGGGGCSGTFVVGADRDAAEERGAGGRWVFGSARGEPPRGAVAGAVGAAGTEAGVLGAVSALGATGAEAGVLGADAGAGVLGADAAADALGAAVEAGALGAGAELAEFAAPGSALGGAGGARTPP
ncbi:hypothetical protein [Sorangium sp. So ce1000]|uniref:hypothetical protein n=1 Tax=Sorangium sp. So ce1000 TaxID=3133325 RepID=UPI003F5F7094